MWLLPSAVACVLPLLVIVAACSDVSGLAVTLADQKRPPPPPPPRSPHEEAESLVAAAASSSASGSASVACELCGDADASFLMALYNSTGGPDWTMGWNSFDLSVCQWFGVSCIPRPNRRNESCLAVQLPGNNLVGSLPDFSDDEAAVSNLCWLDVTGNAGLSGTLPATWGAALPKAFNLSLGSNAFTGFLPASWHRLRNLHTLDVSSNQLEGSLPEDWFAMGRLHRLLLNRNRLTGSLPSLWAALPSLYYIDVAHNQLSGTLPTAWSGLRTINGMSMTSNGFTGTLPESWSELRQAITSMELGNNQLTGTLPASWGLLEFLQWLNVGGNFIAGALPDEWKALTQLYSLRLDGTNLNGTLPSSWGSTLTKLSIFDARDCSLTGTLPDSWGSMPYVRQLLLSYNQLEGTLPESWSQGLIVNCNYLYLSDNRLSGTLPASWGAAWTGITLYLAGNMLNGSIPDTWLTGNIGVLDLSRNRLTGTITDQPTSSWGLNFSHNSLSGRIPRSWSSATGLATIDLSYNQLTYTIPWWLDGTMSSLTTVVLSHNQLEGRLPVWSSYMHMPTLYTVDFSHNNLYGDLPNSWTQSLNLTNVNLRFNQLYGTLPASWSVMNNLVSLDISNNDLTGPLPDSWGSMTNALGLPVVLNLSSNALTGSLPAAWNSLLLQELDLSSNNLTGTLPAPWYSMSRLTRLILRNNGLEGTLPNAWVNLRDLEQLDITDNLLQGPLPSGWSSIQNANGMGIRLQLSNNRIDGTLPTSWSGATDLEAVHLDHNQLTGTLPPAWQLIHSLRYLDLRQNRLSGSLPDAWATLPKLGWLDVSDNNVTGGLPASWSEGFPTAALSINVSCNRLSGMVPSGWLTRWIERPPNQGTPFPLLLDLHDNELSGCLRSTLLSTGTGRGNGTCDPGIANQLILGNAFCGGACSLPVCTVATTCWTNASLSALIAAMPVSVNASACTGSFRLDEMGNSTASLLADASIDAVAMNTYPPFAGCELVACASVTVKDVTGGPWWLVDPAETTRLWMIASSVAKESALLFSLTFQAFPSVGWTQSALPGRLQSLTSPTADWSDTVALGTVGFDAAFRNVALQEDGNVTRTAPPRVLTATYENDAVHLTLRLASQAKATWIATDSQAMSASDICFMSLACAAPIRVGIAAAVEGEGDVQLNVTVARGPSVYIDPAHGGAGYSWFTWATSPAAGAGGTSPTPPPRCDDVVAINCNADTIVMAPVPAPRHYCHATADRLWMLSLTPTAVTMSRMDLPYQRNARNVTIPQALYYLPFAPSSPVVAPRLYLSPVDGLPLLLPGTTGLVYLGSRDVPSAIVLEGTSDSTTFTVDDETGERGTLPCGVVPFCEALRWGGSDEVGDDGPAQLSPLWLASVFKAAPTQTVRWIGPGGWGRGFLRQDVEISTTSLVRGANVPDEGTSATERRQDDAFPPPCGSTGAPPCPVSCVANAEDCLSAANASLRLFLYALLTAANAAPNQTWESGGDNRSLCTAERRWHHTVETSSLVRMRCVMPRHNNDSVPDRAADSLAVRAQLWLLAPWIGNSNNSTAVNDNNRDWLLAIDVPSGTRDPYYGVTLSCSACASFFQPQLSPQPVVFLAFAALKSVMVTIVVSLLRLRWGKTLSDVWSRVTGRLLTEWLMPNWNPHELSRFLRRSVAPPRVTVADVARRLQLIVALAIHDAAEQRHHGAASKATGPPRPAVPGMASTPPSVGPDSPAEWIAFARYFSDHATHDGSRFPVVPSSCRAGGDGGDDDNHIADADAVGRTPSAWEMAPATNALRDLWLAWHCLYSPGLPEAGGDSPESSSTSDGSQPRGHDSSADDLDTIDAAPPDDRDDHPTDVDVPISMSIEKGGKEADHVGRQGAGGRESLQQLGEALLQTREPLATTPTEAVAFVPLAEATAPLSHPQRRPKKISLPRAAALAPLSEGASIQLEIEPHHCPPPGAVPAAKEANVAKSHQAAVERLRTALAAVNAQLDPHPEWCERLIIEDVLLESLLCPQPVMLWFDTVYCLVLVAASITTALRDRPPSAAPWQTYQTIYFAFVNATAPATLLVNAVTRLRLRRHPSTMDKVFVILSVALLLPPLATHCLPGMVCYAWIFGSAGTVLTLTHWLAYRRRRRIMPSRMKPKMTWSGSFRLPPSVLVLLRALLRAVLLLAVSWGLPLSYNLACLVIYNNGFVTSSAPSNIDCASEVARPSYLHALELDLSSRSVVCAIDSFATTSTNVLRNAGALLASF